jgi:hypothetical protein
MAKLTSTDIYGSLLVQGTLLSNSTLTGTRLISTVANGTAPLTVASTTVVSNLNADLLDGQQGSHYLNYNNLTNKPTIPAAAGNGTITISAGTGLATGGSFTVNQTGNTTVTLNHSNTVTAATVGPSAGGTLAFSGTFTVPQITYDAQGHISGTELRTFTLPATPQGATLVNLAFSNGASIIDTYDPDGANGKQFTAGTNITMTAASNNVTISSPNVAVTDSGTGNGVVGITANGHGITVTKGTFLTSFTEADTLDSVTGRGNTTTNDINVGNITTTGYLRGPSTFVIDPAVHGNNTGTLVIAGNLQVDGTTTIINSTVKTIDDPVITLGGDTAPTSDDAKDRGIEFRYFDTAARLGFFGYDRSINSFTGFRLATNTNEVFSGTLMDARFNSFVGSLGAVGTPSFTFTGDTNTGIWSSGADTLNISTAGAERLRISSTGNVGIGTSVPQRKVHLIGGDVYVSTTSDTAGTGSFGGNSFEIRNSTTGEHFNLDLYNRTTNAWYTPFHIQNTGNVGIGTASPGVKLDVEGSGRFNGTFTENTTTQGAYIGYLTTPRILFANGTAAQNWQIDNSAGNFRWFLPGSARMTLSTEALTLDHATSGILRALGSGNSYFTGNLGIGTASPATKLDVLGNFQISRTDTYTSHWRHFISHTATSDYGTLYLDSNSATGNFVLRPNGVEKFRVSAGGNVGIGTSSPARLLSLSRSATDFTPSILVTNTSANSGSTSHTTFLNGTDTLGLNIGKHSSGFSTPDLAFIVQEKNAPINFATNNIERMRISADGNVGIGTTSPGQKLEVVGNTKTQDLIISDTSNVAKATMTYDSTSKSVKFVFA